VHPPIIRVAQLSRCVKYLIAALALSLAELPLVTHPPAAGKLDPYGVPSSPPGGGLKASSTFLAQPPTVDNVGAEHAPPLRLIPFDRAVPAAR
jgi:hypothetical protein